MRNIDIVLDEGTFSSEQNHILKLIQEKDFASADKFLQEKHRKKSIKPIAPYSNNSQSAVYDTFIDYFSGKVRCGEEFWLPLSDVFVKYCNHPESKFINGDEEGVMDRSHIKVNGIKYIGKEIKCAETSLIDEKPEGIKIRD